MNEASTMTCTVTRTQCVKAPARICVPCLQLASDREVYERSVGDASWDVSGSYRRAVATYARASEVEVPTRAARTCWGYDGLSGSAQSA